MNGRHLSVSEIGHLEARGCTAEDWHGIHVADGFDRERLRNVRLSGEVFLGRFDGEKELPGGQRVPSGIADSRLHDCTVGDNVVIAGVARLSGYDVEADAVLLDVGSIVMEGESAFGNGIELDCVNEAGGRGFAMFDRLSAQMAYILALYRHKPELIRALHELIAGYVETKKSKRGLLGRGCRVANSGSLVNVRIEPFAVVEGALRLEDGTVAGSEQAPGIIGEGVTARHFIVLEASRVDGSVHLENCFVGQGVLLGKQFSAENTAFFANCEGFHGEVCSVLAGPYTVTHHKSTLLIAGLFSFYNAGSGTNQSNHMYKLGPVHQGILERGVKTGSSSYLLWPCRIGAFTTVIGKHYANFDTSEFPFSYINETDGRSVLSPGLNLMTVGTRRDSDKWKQRDRRKGARKLDLIHFELLNPYTVGRMIGAHAAARALYENTPRTQEYVLHGGIHIGRLMLRTCSRFYEMGIRLFVGRCLMARLEPLLDRELTMSELRQALGVDPGITPNGEERPGVTSPGVSALDAELPRWVDMCGLLAPASAIEALTDAIAAGGVADIAEVQDRLESLHAGYAHGEWAWCLRLMERRLDTLVAEMTSTHLSAVIKDWQQSTVKLNNTVLKDAEKEFGGFSRIGFGIDGDQKDRDADFEAVRGVFADNKFVRQIQEDTKAVESRASQLLTWLKTVRG